jgi:hypothetical protein
MPAATAINFAQRDGLPGINICRASSSCRWPNIQDRWAGWLLLLTAFDDGLTNPPTSPRTKGEPTSLSQVRVVGAAPLLSDRSGKASTSQRP